MKKNIRLFVMILLAMIFAVSCDPELDLSIDTSLSEVTIADNNMQQSLDNGSEVFEYFVSKDEDTLEISLVKTDAKASIEIINVTDTDSDVILSNTQLNVIPLIKGTNIISIVIYAENREYIREYSIKVYRFSDDPLLKSAYPGKGLFFDKDFQSVITNYNCRVPNGQETITLKLATEVDSTEIIYKNQSSKNEIDILVNLEIGDNIIEVNCIAEDNTEVLYTFIIRRLSDDPFLKEFIIDEPNMNVDFDTSVFNYNISVNYDVSSINYRTSLSNSDSSIFINGVEVVDNPLFVHNLLLLNNLNSIDILVKSENNTQLLYQFNIVREQFIGEIKCSLDEGIYTNQQIIKMTGYADGAVIKYTLDGSTPSENHGFLYNNDLGITINGNCSLKAIAFKDSFTQSEVFIQEYQFEVGVVTLDQDSGNFQNDILLVPACTTEEVNIYYTIDGSVPSLTNGQTWLKNTAGDFTDISLNLSCNFRLIAVKNGYKDSVILDNDYLFEVSDISISQGNGDFYNDFDVYISCDTDSAKIYYTLDGSDPTAINGSPVSVNVDGSYMPVRINATTSIRFRAFKEGYAGSAIADRQYQMLIEDLSVDMNDGTYTDNLITNISCSTENAQIFYSLDGSIPSKKNGTELIITNGTGSLMINRSCIFKVFAIKDGYSNSGILSRTYNFQVAALSSDMASGTFNNDITVNFSCSTDNALIFYTLDGSTPTTDNGINLGSGRSIVISGDAELNAIAIKLGYENSEILNDFYYFEIAELSINIDGGSFETNKNLSFSCTTGGVTILYTLDGSLPLIESASTLTIDESLVISTNAHLNAIAIKDGYQDSNLIDEVYSYEVQPLTVSTSGGTFYESFDLILNCSTIDNIIYYTLDGSDPDQETSDQLPSSGVLTVDRSIDLKAIAVKTGFISSNIISETYSVKTNELTILSSADLSYNEDITVQFLCETPGFIIRYTTDGSDPDIDTSQILTEHSSVNCIELVLSESQNIKAIACFDNYDSSAIVSKEITFAVKTPNFFTTSTHYDSTAKTYYNEARLYIRSDTSFVSYHYTIDGSVPTVSSPVIVPINNYFYWNESVDLSIIGFKQGYKPSVLLEESLSFRVRSVYFSATSSLYASKDIMLSTNTANAELRYTTDGSEPTYTHGLLIEQSGNIVIDKNTTVKVFAYCVGYESIAAERIYSMVVDNIRVIRHPGTYNYSLINNFKSLSKDVEGLNYFYTTDGTDPTPINGDVFDFSMIIDKPITIKFRGYMTGYTTSSVQTFTYQFSAGTLSFSQDVLSGTYYKEKTLKIKKAHPDIPVYYTTDGTEPSQTNGSQLTGDSLTVDRSCNIKIKAEKEDWTPSNVLERDYLIQVENIRSGYRQINGYEYYTSLPLTCSSQVKYFFESNTAGASYKYTFDNTEPTLNNGIDYTAGDDIIFNQTQFFRIKAFYNNYDSAELTHDFVFLCNDPTIFQDSGIYYNSFELGVNSSSNASSKYTLDGTDPSELNGQLYSASEPLQMNAPSQLKMISLKEGYTDSNIIIRNYSFRVEPLVLNHSNDGFIETAKLQVSTGTENVIIKYTLDGSLPSEVHGQIAVNGQIILSESSSVNIIGLKIGYSSSPILQATITVKNSSSFSIICGGEGEDTIKAFKVLNDGSYLVAGESYSDTLYPDYGDQFTASINSNLYLMKMDTDGNKLWDRFYNNAGDCYAFNRADIIEQSSDGEILIGGRTSSDSTFPRTSGSTGIDGYLISLNEYGGLNWHHRLAYDDQLTNIYKLDNNLYRFGRINYGTYSTYNRYGYFGIREGNPSAFQLIESQQSDYRYEQQYFYFGNNTHLYLQTWYNSSERKEGFRIKKYFGTVPEGEDNWQTVQYAYGGIDYYLSGKTIDDQIYRFMQVSAKLKFNLFDQDGNITLEKEITDGNLVGSSNTLHSVTQTASGNYYILVYSQNSAEYRALEITPSGDLLASYNLTASFPSITPYKIIEAGGNDLALIGEFTDDFVPDTGINKIGKDFGILMIREP